MWQNKRGRWRIWNMHQLKERRANIRAHENLKCYIYTEKLLRRGCYGHLAQAWEAFCSRRIEWGNGGIMSWVGTQQQVSAAVQNPPNRSVCAVHLLIPNPKKKKKQPQILAFNNILLYQRICRGALLSEQRHLKVPSGLHKLKKTRRNTPKQTKDTLTFRLPLYFLAIHYIKDTFMANCKRLIY